jgi:hypothetical protein
MRISAVITCLLVVAQSLAAGQSGLGLRAIVVQGNGARNIIEQIPPTPLIVRVVDRNDRPVPGATVVFSAPEAGPSGDFANGMGSLTTLTDENGLAAAPHFAPNASEGAYQIAVRAQYLDEVALTRIAQTNVAPKKSFAKMIVILAAAGGAAAGAAVLAGRSSSGSPASAPSAPASPVTTPAISFGGATVGTPR